jgi:uncharacterized protein (DUF4213/DUF364 family)
MLKLKDYTIGLHWTWAVAVEYVRDSLECKFLEQDLYNAIEGFSETSNCTRDYVTSHKKVTFLYRSFSVRCVAENLAGQREVNSGLLV